VACSLISFYYEHFLAPLQAAFYKGWHQRFVTRFSVILMASQWRRRDGKHVQCVTLGMAQEQARF
jgi:hypothetical protein